MTALILRADARHLPLPDASVDLIVTSPPYYALRSYQDNGSHYDGQIGAEPTPAAYVDNLIGCTREWLRVLKPSGSIWLNLGDKYAQNVERSRNGVDGALKGPNPLPAPVYTPCRDNGVRTKSLLGLPWRYALRCIDELGLILRAEVIWSKPNGLPESVTDRVRRSHEQWFHFVRQPRYYSAVDRIRDAYAPETAARYALGYKANGRTAAGQQSTPSIPIGVRDLATNPLGKLPGSVWTIPTQPLKVPEHLGIDHFAAFPMEWPRRIIQGWSPEGICTGCGEGRRPVRGGEWRYSDPRNEHAATALRRAVAVGLTAAEVAERYGLKSNKGDNRSDRTNNVHPNTLLLAEVLGGRLYAFQLQSLVKQGIAGDACGCPDTSAPTRPAVVLDPFSGTGTTALVAHALGRIGIGVDMSADYCRLAQWRTTDPGQLAAALEVEKPPKQLDGQDDLLALLGES